MSDLNTKIKELIDYAEEHEEFFSAGILSVLVGARLMGDEALLADNTIEFMENVLRPRADRLNDLGLDKNQLN